MPYRVNKRGGMILTILTKLSKYLRILLGYPAKPLWLVKMCLRKRLELSRDGSI